MTLHTFIIKNALRNKRRALLCVMSVAVSVFLLVALLVALRELMVPPEDIGAACRIIVRSKISLANRLPFRQRPIIEHIRGVEVVTPFTWFGGKFRNDEIAMFGQFAVDPAAMPFLFTEAKIDPDQARAFIQDRTACLIGKDMAAKYNLRLGDRITLVGTIYPCDLELKVAAIYGGTIDDRNLFFHHKYLDEAIGGNSETGTWWVKVRQPEDMASVVTAINRAFANTSAEVRAETERAFQLSMVSMFANVKILIHSICSVVVFTLVLVTASTMSMAIRERFRELAVLKAIGFRRRELFACILAESFGLSLTGAVLGAGGAWALSNYADIPKLTNNVFTMLEVTPMIMGQAFVVAAGLGIIASLAPAVAVARMSVVEGLKTLD